MKSSLLMDFSLDRENSTILIKREFLATNDLVWSAWTQPEILDQWWAPLPWKSVTKKMEFSEGGTRLYAMIGPNGEEHWALAEYYKIMPQSSFKYLDAFCNDQGEVNPDFPRGDWYVQFNEQSDQTVVNVSIKHNSLEDLEKMIEMGFKEGLTMALEHLDTILTNYNKK